MLIDVGCSHWKSVETAGSQWVYLSQPMFLLVPRRNLPGHFWVRSTSSTSLYLLYLLCLKKTTNTKQNKQKKPSKKTPNLKSFFSVKPLISVQLTDAFAFTQCRYESFAVQIVAMLAQGWLLHARLVMWSRHSPWWQREIGLTEGFSSIEYIVS